MIVWTVANQKGGVGKTTSVVALAGLLAQRNKRVLLIDTDPHGSLTAYLDYNSDALQGTLFDLFQAGAGRAEFDRVALQTRFEGITLLPASISLATLERTSSSREGMGLVLKRLLAEVKHDFDVAIIDCPPVLGVMMVNALAACDRILVPVQTEFLALKGLERMVSTFKLMHKARKDGFNYTVVPTMYDQRTRASVQSLESLKEQYGDRVWPAVVPVDTKFRDASLRHEPPSYYAKGSRGVYAYQTLLRYLWRLDGGDQPL
ncbi:ParA family protein [Oceanimonas baumannii]|uniref:Chromosome partitioning protein n=1 Tax=Oceanimonas baumannii TaxID=129578 RepID=A0A235CMZ0_9GAMM|nr:ParA family protein [Oceanimonas baumannii]OYD25931.1 cobalamin biosynthesis protein CobQ [Oceanimonas baumannii]TDW60051.1 chromosome partitioning protein [Oceanimonas baumannii]